MNISKTHSFGLSSGYEELDIQSIDFPIKKNLLGQKCSIDIKVDSFAISAVKVSPYLVVKNNLLKIKFIGGVGKEGVAINNFHLTTYNNPYQVLLNHDAIIDCTDLNEDDALVQFDVRLIIEGKSIVRSYTLNLHLIKAKPACEITFVPQSQLMYCHENVSVGHFEVINNCNYRYAELAAISLSLKYSQQYNEDIVSFGLTSECKENNPYYEKAGLREKGESPISILKVASPSSQEIVLKRLISQNNVRIPVYMDLERLENPTENIQNEEFYVVTKNLLNDISDSPRKCIVPIYRDKTTTSLSVICNSSIVENNSRCEYGHYGWLKHLTGKKERFGGVLQIFDVKIGNKATNRGEYPDSAVILKNIKAIPVYNEREILTNPDFLETREIEDDLFVLKNGVDSFVSFTCKLKHKYINDIPDNHAKISLNIEFDYIEDTNGDFGKKNQLEWSHFHAVAIVDLEKDPGSEWLCVDYGTSATVAIFGDGTDHNLALLPLNQRNKEIIDERENERFRTPRFEEGDYFLSSNIMLQSNTPSLDSETYRKSLVYLSPSEPIFHSQGLRLPYMKALAGYKDVPNSERYSRFTYKIHESDSKVLTFEENPLDVDKIFKATYRSLFKDYISECIPSQKEINKIILTIPNTYTPHHIEFLRNIVKSEIPSLRSDYIWFVSESDAIAYYYIRNWDICNSNRENNFIGKKEHILVYDMGAGTLDLTYLTIDHLESGDKNVAIIAKMGLNKAGNYLDYVLAEALVDVYPSLFSKELLHSTDDSSQRLLGQLKFFIKNELKPQLYSKNQITFSLWNNQNVLGVDFNDVIIDLKLIRSNKLVQEFISECTNQLFDRFMQINNLKMDESSIDTLITTGRSIQFGNIKEQLQKRINVWNDDSHCKSIEIKGEQLKTIVAQGALYYAALYGKRTSSVALSNRNIYAAYGVLYVDRKNKWCYQPLINSTTRSTTKSVSKTGQLNGMQVFTYDTDRFSADDTKRDITLDMRNTIEAYLIQCYSVDPAKDYMDEEHRNDYISIMTAFNPESVCNDTKNVHIRLEVNENNEMTFTAGYMTFEPSAPIKIDVETNKTFKHSMWPYA